MGAPGSTTEGETRELTQLAFSRPPQRRSFRRFSWQQSPHYATHLYFATSPEREGQIKIGISRNPRRRLVALKADPVAVFACAEGDAWELEKQLHAHYAAQRTDGEWFTITDDLLAETVGVGAILELYQADT